MTTLALTLLAVAAVILVVRVLVGPSVAHRIVAVDALLVVVISGLAVNAAATGSAAFVDVAVVVGLLGFVSTGVAARYIERRGLTMSTLGDVLFVVGSAWAVLAAGVLRLDDLFSRMLAATETTTLGLLLVPGGAALQLPAGDALKLLLVGVLAFLTAPVGAHLIGRAAHRPPGHVRIRIDTVDELGPPG